jgi:hypothetical protein
MPSSPASGAASLHWSVRCGFHWNQPCPDEINDLTGILTDAVGTDVHIRSNENNASVVTADRVALGQFPELVIHQMVLVEALRPGRRNKHGLHSLTVACRGRVRRIPREIDIVWSARA